MLKNAKTISLHRILKIALIIENYYSNAPTSAVRFLPERASHFEMLKEFQAAQNTTCHLLSANTISFIDCLEIFRIELINDSKNKSRLSGFAKALCRTKKDRLCQTKTV
ncbi:MAG: hypothetical protein ACYC25_14165 [Paludibacter sp.]